MPTCPNGHQSGSDDWCEVCGHRMAGAVPPPPPPPPPAGGHGFPPAAPGAGPQPCPQCRTPREGAAPFCEECRWNFLTNMATSYTPAAPRPSSGPPTHFQQQPAPSAPPPAYGGGGGGDSYPGARPPEYQGSRPSQINRPAEPIPQGPPGFGSEPSRPVPPPPGPPPGAPGGPGGGSRSGAPDAPGGFGGPSGPGSQTPGGASGRPGNGPGATAPDSPPSPWQQQAGASVPPPPPPPAPAYPREGERQQPSGPPRQGGPSSFGGGGDDDWRIAPPGGGQNGPGGRGGYGYPQPGGHQAPPPQPGYGYPHQPQQAHQAQQAHQPQQSRQQQPQPPRPPQPQGPWTATIGPDREYFMAMMQRSGPEAAGLNLPAYSAEQQRPLTGNQVTIGRRRHSTGDTPDIDLSVPPEDPGVSHQHAILVQQPDGGWAVVDQNSTNGTTVNGGEDPIQPYVPVPLQDGDRVHVGAWTTITIRRG